jgi:WhiB family transcriptional regulator, redox-sensing transcriptional regulator
MTQHRYSIDSIPLAGGACGADYLYAPTRDELEWQLQGLCSNHDPDLWYPESRRRRRSASRPAQEICKQCPVIQQCAEWAVTHHEEFGVCGLSEVDREKIWGSSRRTGRFRRSGHPSLAS